MTTREVAQLLGIKPASVKVACLRERLRAVKRGRDWWIEEADAVAYRDRREGRKVNNAIAK
jgi:hypothetical protein